MFIKTMSNSKKMMAVAINKSLLKEYKTNDDARVVYLKNGDEFQIQLFNPTNDVIGAEISINSDKLNGLIVLKPGERVWLERYLDTAKKFLFSTYEVEDGNADVAKAIKNNGEITVRFYHEKKKKDKPIQILNEPWYHGWTPYYNHKVETKLNSSNVRCLGDNILYGGIDSQVCTSSSPDVYNRSVTASTNSCGSAGYATNDAVSNLNAKIDCDYKISSDVENSLSSLAFNDSVMKDYDFADTQVNSKMIETGRINEGSYSNQEFKTVNNDFEYWSFDTETIKILPMSRKPYTASDLQKVFCTECGRKLNPKHKFCPYCGTKVE